MNISDRFPIDKWNFKSESILADLPPEDLKALIANQSESAYKKGEVIFREGAYPSGVYYVIEGKVKKYKIGSDGKEHIIYIAPEGEVIGFHAILAEDRYPDSAAALEESRVAFIPREDFLMVMQKSTVLNKRILKTLSHEFAVLTNSLSTFSEKSVRERLAIHLIVLREKYKKNFQQGMSVEINIGRNDLASLVGTARENVVRFLSEFKDDGILDTCGSKIIVRDVNRLIKIANH